MQISACGLEALPVCAARRAIPWAGYNVGGGKQSTKSVGDLRLWLVKVCGLPAWMRTTALLHARSACEPALPLTHDAAAAANGTADGS